MSYLFQKYPQNLWARTINKMIKNEKFDLIVDAPCGNGIIACLSAIKFPDTPYLAIDNDSQQLDSNILRSKPINVNSQLGDIFKTKIKHGNNAWLFINSLYCLPEKEKLMACFSVHFNSIYAVFPDITSRNYQYFSQKHPDFENPSAMKLSETIDFIESYGFKLINRQPVTAIPFHKWNPILDKIGLNFKLKNLIFTLTDSMFFFRRKHYEIMEFKRYE